MHNLFELLRKLTKNESRKSGFWSAIKLIIIAFLAIVLATFTFSFIILFSFLFLLPWLLFSGRGKVQNLKMFFINKGWVQLKDIVKFLNLSKWETKMVLHYSLLHSGAQIKYTVSEKFFKDISIKELEEFTILRSVRTYNVPTPFEKGKVFKLIFHEKYEQGKTFNINYVDYSEYVLDVDTNFSVKKFFYRDLIGYMVDNPDKDVTLEKLGFSIEIFVPTKIKGKKIKKEKSKFSFGSVFGYR